MGSFGVQVPAVSWLWVACVGGTLVPGAATSALALWFRVWVGTLVPQAARWPSSLLWPRDFQSWSVVSEKQLSNSLNRMGPF